MNVASTAIFVEELKEHLAWLPERYANVAYAIDKAGNPTYTVDGMTITIEGQSQDRSTVLGLSSNLGYQDFQVPLDSEELDQTSKLLIAGYYANHRKFAHSAGAEM